MSKFKYLFLACFLVTQSVSAEELKQTFRFDVQGRQYRVWFRGEAQLDEVQIVQIQKDFEEINSAIILSRHFPKAISILVDSEWKKSSGYWSENLKAPDGTDAALMTPKSFLSSDSRKPLLVHELAHYVHFHLRPNEQSWLREAVGLLIESRVTGNDQTSLLAYKGYPESLVADLNLTKYDESLPDGRGFQYGHLNLFFDYLYRNCGKEALLNEILSSSMTSSGIEFLSNVLRVQENAPAICESFDSAFEAYLQAFFKPKHTKQWQYVVLSDLKPELLKARPVSPLKPYSFFAYKAPKKGCSDPKDIRFSQTGCFAYRKQ